MQTTSFVASLLLASGLAAAGKKEYHTPVECTPPAVAYTTAVHTTAHHTTAVHTTVTVAYTKPAYTASVHTPVHTPSSSQSIMTFQQYGPSSSTYVNPIHPVAYTSPTQSHATVSVAETKAPVCPTENHPYEGTGKHSLHTTTSSTYSTKSTSSMTTAAKPTYTPAQGAGNQLDAKAAFAGTVVAGLFLFM